MIGQASDPILAKAEQAVAAKVPANLQKVFAGVVQAGNHILYSPQLSGPLQHRMNQSVSNPGESAGQGAVRLVAELFKQSGKKIPPALLSPAAMTFAFEFLDLMAKAGKAKITSQMVADAAQAVGDSMLTAVGVTKDKLQQAIREKQQAPTGMIQQPQGA